MSGSYRIRDGWVRMVAYPLPDTDTDSGLCRVCGDHSVRHETAPFCSKCVAMIRRRVGYVEPPKPSVDADPPPAQPVRRVMTTKEWYRSRVEESGREWAAKNPTATGRDVAFASRFFGVKHCEAFRRAALSALSVQRQPPSESFVPLSPVRVS